MKPINKPTKKQTFFATLKEAKEQCQSYYEQNGQLRGCTCGTCKTNPTPLTKEQD